MLKEIKTGSPYHIGIIGGGQLGKMMTMAAKQMGFQVIVLDPTPRCPAGQIADKQIIASFTDSQALRDLARECEVLTYEFEHIDSQTLISLEAEGLTVYPTPQSLKIIQNKYTQKKKLVQADILVPRFQKIQNLSDLWQAGEKFGYPLIVKSVYGGYDGKGNWQLTKAEEAQDLLNNLPDKELMAEEFVNFRLELSIIAARGVNGEVKIFPLAENHHQDHILNMSVIPARISSEINDQAKEVARKVMDVFQGVGVFCIELFLTADDCLLVNEVAPRPHNSGHYTIEACPTSQFEQHIRAITTIPLGDTTLINPAVMVNLLGEEPHQGPAVLIGVDKALALPGLHLHFYGKHDTQPRRKMGHFTVIHPLQSEAIVIAKQAANYLKVISK